MKTTIIKYFFSIIAIFSISFSFSQTTAMNFSGKDCNNNDVNLFADLDAGKAVVLFFYMPNCGSCPPPAQKIQTMANNINANNPGRVKAYAFPYQNSTSCTYSASWVTSNNLSLYAPMDSGAVQVAYYGGFGMPTVVLLDGTNHSVKFVTQDFNTADTTTMRDLILGSNNISQLSEKINFEIIPNPADQQITINGLPNSIEINEITITSIDGKKVSHFHYSKSNSLSGVDVSHLINGNYILTLKTNEGEFKKALNIYHK